MLSQGAVDEFRQQWLPNVTDGGLEHLRSLLDQHSPLLVRGNWISDFPPNSEVSDFSKGCLATHIAWFHPETAQMHLEAGYQWLHEVVGIQSVASHVLREWDAGSKVEAELAYLVREEQQRRFQHSYCEQPVVKVI